MSTAAAGIESSSQTGLPSLSSTTMPSSARNLIAAASAVLAVTLSAAMFGACSGSRSEPARPDMSTAADTAWYDAAWARVDSLENEGLPRSAAEGVQQIYEAASRDGNEPQLVKSLIYRGKHAYQLEDEAINTVVVDLRSHLDELSSPASAILHSILGDVYWGHLTANRYRYYNRTDLAAAAQNDDDILTWGLSRLVAASIRHYRASVEDRDALSMPVDAFELLLLESEGTRRFRPTLFDLLAHRALDVFENAEAGLSEPVRAFVVEAERFLVPAEAFVSIDLADEDSLSLEVQALRLHQNLLRAHTDDEQRDAFVHADVRRLRFVRNRALEWDGEPYLTALERLESEVAGESDLAAYVQLARAHEFHRQGQSYDPNGDARFKWRLRDALEVCEGVRNAFPDSQPAATCGLMRSSVLREEIDIQSEGAVVPGQPALLRVGFRNTPTLYWRAYPIDRDYARDRLLSRRDEDRYADALVRNGTPVLSGEYALPVDGDYHRHATEVILPALESGPYVIVAGNHADLNRESGTRYIAMMLSSRLSYFSRSAPDGSLIVYVVDRDTGHPIEGARMTPYVTDYRAGGRADPGETKVTDTNGRVSTPPTLGGAVSLQIEHDGEWLFSESPLYAGRRLDREDETSSVTRFFTDRAIYRPGQTIHFKGILLTLTGDRYEIRRGARSNVRLHDVNGREVARAELTSNEFGTVSGQFTAPRAGLTGEMTITDDNGSVSVSVEEYKRPRFETTMDPFRGQASIGDEVTVRGDARSFAAAPVGAARVAWRVQRSVYYPWRWGRMYYPPPSQAEIAYGVAETDASGGFEVTFEARPATDVRRAWLPVYDYVISVEVTDVAGETQTAQTTVTIGERSMMLALATPDVVDRGGLRRFHVSATTLNGEPLETTGRIKVSKLQEPSTTLTPDWQPVDTVTIGEAEWWENFPYLAYPGTAEPESWSADRVMIDEAFATPGTAQNAAVEIEDPSSWPVGMYRVELVADDDQGREVRSISHIRVIDTGSRDVPGSLTSWFHVIDATAEPGEQAGFLVGSHEDDVRILVETERRGDVETSRWLSLSDAQQRIDVPVTEAHRGNFAIHATLVRHNRFFLNANIIRVPYSNKELSLRWETFRDKLEPGQEETWRLRISGPKGESVAAELVAAMYDASLDQFRAHDWYLSLWPSHGTGYAWNGMDLRRNARFARFTDTTYTYYSEYEAPFDRLNLFGLQLQYYGYRQRPMTRGAAVDAIQQRGEAIELEAALDVNEPGARVDRDEGRGGPPQAGPPPEPPPLRSNFDETAFFLPHLRTNADGETIISFTMPESLTRWRFLGLAHTTDLKSGTITGETVTQREMMITTNAPRFLRHGDTITMTAVVDNLSDQALLGTAGLSLANAVTGEPLAVDLTVENPVDGREGRSRFTVDSGESARTAWTFAVPENVDAVTYRVDATSDAFADGEESVLPVLTNRMLVTESLPLPMRGPGSKTFTFDRLLNADSPTLRHERVTVEYTANPVWYAVQALPYIMEYPYECAEQVFARFYANGIATYLVDENPAIETVFAEWLAADAPSLMSNLERNQELKALLIEETPWLRHARNEAERKRRIATLMDLVRMRGEIVAAAQKLSDLQYPDGSWPWFAGMQPNRYITQHIVRGIGAMRKMGVLELIDDGRPLAMARSSVGWIDQQLRDDLERLKERGADLDERHIGWVQLHALYTRSFFPDVPVADDAREAYDYFLGQVEEYGLDLAFYGQGMAALTLHRDGRTQRARAIIASLREYARQDEELGMYWPISHGWWWYEAPVETQALLIEAFHEVADDAASVEAMQLWLLKQKQTTDWRTTRATTDAVYALLQRGQRLLDSPGFAVVTVGDHEVTTADPSAEAGTGYLTATWMGAAVEPEMGDVTVTKEGPGPAWGAVYWQYFEDLDRITSAETPLRLEKQLYVNRQTDAGTQLVEVNESTRLAPGDLITVRIIVRSDREMEYVHLKDMRASGFEPVNVLSGYRWQDGLGYYESTRDAATNFFIARLAPGTYVFEYPLRVRHAGDFSNGVTTIQSMYAPEFSAHSEGLRVVVQ